MSSDHDTNQRVRVTASGLDLDGELLPLIAGEIHYFQHPQVLWPRLLDAAVELGLTCISTYVPWGRHDLGRGRYDFGDIDERLDLEGFVQAVDARGLKLILRPGPHINAELTWLGYPKYVLEDDTIWARTAGGNPVWLPINPRPIPVPSYASDRFLETVDRWLEEVGGRFAPWQWPAGPLVAVQLDNEAPLLFRNGPFDQDYHPDMVALFQEYLASRGRPGELPPSSLDADTPEDLLPVLDWIACRNNAFAEALKRMRAVLERAGLERVVYTHNVAQSGVIPEVAPSEFDAADMVGVDFYHQRSQSRLIRDRCRYAVGSCDLPFAAELGVGGPWNLPARSSEDSLFQAKAVVAWGFRALNFFMAADRDRYYGAPISARSPGLKQEPVATGLVDLVKAFKRAKVHGLRLRATVAIIVPRLYPTMTQATWTLGPFGPPVLQALGMTPQEGASEDRFGFSQAIQIAWFEALQYLTGALDRSGLGWVIVDGEGAGKRLDEISPNVVLALTYDCIERNLWELLISRAAKGLAVVIGPEIPTLNEDMKPLEEAVTLEGACESGLQQVDFNDKSSCHDLARALESRLEIPKNFRTDASGVDVTVMEEAGEARVVGVVELEGRRRRVALTHGEQQHMELRDLISGDVLDRDAISLSPYGVRLIELRTEIEERDD